MKDNKFYPLLLLSILFLIVSFVLLCVLGYNFYTQQNVQAKKINSLPTQKNIAITNNKTRDTLQKLYDVAIHNFPNSQVIDSSLIKADSAAMGIKLGEVNKLKTEISSLLKDSTGDAQGLELARGKIKELQVMVESLKTKNIDIEKENKRLKALLEQASQNNSALSSNVQAYPKTDKQVVDNFKSSSSLFVANDIKFTTANDTEDEVNTADVAEKFIGSLIVKNSLVQGMGEVMLVLIQPDGKVLRNAWESGSFETDNGKKIYSRKIKFDYNKGESRRLNFSMQADNIQKGTYTLQVYNNGKVIGKLAKVIS